MIDNELNDNAVVEETSVDNTSVEETVVENTEVEEPVQPVEAETAKEAPVAEDADERASNFRQMRIDKARAERDLAETRKLLSEIQESRKPVQQKEEESTFGDDDLIEGKHLRREVERLKNNQKRYEEVMKQQADENRLQSKYSDFKKVVNDDTLMLLKEEDPEFAETIATSSASLYARGSSTYKRIKDLGLYVEDKHEPDRLKAQANMAKPKAVNSISPQRGNSPLEQANAFANSNSKEAREQLWREVQEATKNQ